MKKAFLAVAVLAVSVFAFAQTSLVDITGSEGFGSVWDKGTGSYASHSGGNIVFSGEGCIAANTDVGAGDKWLRFRMVSSSPTSDTGFFVGDSSGNGVIFILADNGGFYIDSESEYTGYDTWADNDNSIAASAGTYNSANHIGVTIAASSKTIRLWNGVTADSLPDAVDSWDSGAADVSWTALGTMTNSRVGFGSWIGGPASDYDYLEAGDFSGGGGSALVKIAGSSQRLAGSGGGLAGR